MITKRFYSPSDLIRFMESPFASWMDRYVLEFPHLAPEKDPQDALSCALQQRGFAHEDQLEMSFREQDLSVVKIEGKSNTEKLAATLSSMQQGADIIAQARLETKGFRGFADFLIKTPGDSLLGDFHYEVWDTKLSRHLKPAHAIQLCCYAEMLEAIQGERPTHITVVLGDGDKQTLRTNDYYHYYLKLKESFLIAQKNFNPEQMPDPADFKNWGDWSNYAENLLTEKDHLYQVANITWNQIKKLNKQGIVTMQQLADTGIDHVPGMHATVLQNLQNQASIQKASMKQNAPLYEVTVPQEEEKLGLALLPPASPLDVFFDIEGFPLYENGLEYLWGCTYFDESGERQFKDFWAHDKEEEKQAFQEFIHWVYQRWQQDPSMHIYHYANYEIAACRKLMGRYGVCEEEVDQLLRNQVFVDLYKIVKNGLIVGEPRYSIKNIERLYRDKRKTEVGSGGDSVVVYEKWRELHALGEEGRTWNDSPILKSIRDYNIDDCESTQELVVWLRKRQKEHNIAFIGNTEAKEPEIKEEITERLLLRERLLEKAKAGDPNCKQTKLTENLAWMLEFHRRESKPVFWRLFDRLGLSHEELFDDPDCLAFCQRTDRPPFKPTPRSINHAYEYRFDPAQEFKGDTKEFYLLGEEGEKGKGSKVTYIPKESDLEKGLIILQAKKEPKALISLIPDSYIKPDPIPEAITQIVSDYEAGKAKRSAILDFLNRASPSIKGHQDGTIITSDIPEERLKQIIQTVENLDNSYLTIQGPPGSGKSYTAKHVIARLLQAGCKIGISSNSHKAINHLLLSTAAYCNQNGIKASFACTKDTDPALAEQGIAVLEKKQLSERVKPSCVIATTAWGFAREDMSNTLDYLFVDEAGQVAVANLIAMSRSARNLVLIGDQMQLGQPTQGTHPAESGLSILNYLLHESPTISDEMGIFLGTTYRMHPAVNQFISEQIYEGKLKSDLSTALRTVKVPENYNGKLNKKAGIIYVPVHHEGNTQSSEEEVQEIKQLVKELLGRTLVTNNESERPVQWEDILFVTPYNCQSRRLKEALGPNAKVGTVDKFQGQEAPIVFLSMCASDASESSRGLEFLLNKNRINVAISRAQTLAIVVGNPNLANSPANNLAQLKLINLFSNLCTHTILKTL
jgi:predicted RecB family nuclease